MYHKSKNDSDTIILGRRLALQYCQSCHIFPEPDLLDKKTWTKNVLPNMGLRLGLKDAGKNPYSDLAEEDVKVLKELAIYPEIPVLTKEEWTEIVHYYEQSAPSVLISINAQSYTILNNLPQFKPQFLTLFSKKTPQTTLLKFDKATSQLYIGDAQNELYITDSSFRLKETWQIASPTTDINFAKDKKPQLLTIGTIRPSDQKQGQLTSLDTTDKNYNIQNLQRPVCVVTSDLNKDGKEDRIIAQFGNNSGKLSWFDAGDSQKEHVLKTVPGARRVEVHDMNGDNKPDIVALMAQAYEEVVIFYNQGRGKFREKKVLQFPPVYGVSYFEMVDFNNDGALDILLTNGDNWDYSAIKKPYHGVRIYLNDGRDNFKESFFFSLFGTSKAVARDFDKDGDLDIAVTAFYTDLDQPEHSFLYLQNEGNLTFTPFSTPEAAYGKWLTMEVGDFDKDGDDDIILGSYFHTVGEMTKLIFRGVDFFPQLLVLKNNLK
ncbi:MAG: VCBS repeat-containing protein [Saprospiraceae bacterium]|nr:VCBS repeat-containing protein [Saprospiraceae bacterium]